MMGLMDQIRKRVHDLRRGRGDTVSEQPSPIRPEVEAALKDIAEPEDADDTPSGVFELTQLRADIKENAQKAGTTCKIHRNGKLGGNGAIATTADLAEDLRSDTSDDDETSVDFRTLAERSERS